MAFKTSNAAKEIGNSVSLIEIRRRTLTDGGVTRAVTALASCHQDSWSSVRKGCRQRAGSPEALCMRRATLRLRTINVGAFTWNSVTRLWNGEADDGADQLRRDRRGLLLLGNGARCVSSADDPEQSAGHLLDDMPRVPRAPMRACGERSRFRWNARHRTHRAAPVPGTGLRIFGVCWRAPGLFADPGSSAARLQILKRGGAAGECQYAEMDQTRRQIDDSPPTVTGDIWK